MTHAFSPLRFVRIVSLFAIIGGFGVAPVAAAVWGSFDASRVNYAGGQLVGTEHDDLRTIIIANGGTLESPTPTLTPAYLNTVDIFYTSLLNQSTGELSPAEQTALQDWIAAGGTLIVTADIFPLAAYESFTSAYGVTNYVSIGSNGDGTILDVHPLTAGVGVFSFSTNSTFSYGSDARLLADDGAANDFLVVLEPASGFTAGGRIAVFGDHNMFTDSMIGINDNAILATDFVRWAEGSMQSCAWGSFDASRVNYAGGQLVGTAHDSLRSFIQTYGGIIEPPTPSLTPAYLNTVDIFYTSLLNQSTGELSPAEQTALQDWIATGGTLIVTADIFPLSAYESFTSAYGVTNYVDIGTGGNGTILDAHPLTEGVGSFYYNTNSTFSYGGDAHLLADDGSGNDFLVVLEPASGFMAGGRIVVFGDHNMFVDSSIGAADNPIMAGNLARWACDAPQGLPFEDGFESGDTTRWSSTHP